jgi:hypothetical protein
MVCINTSYAGRVEKLGADKLDGHFLFCGTELSANKELICADKKKIWKHNDETSVGLRMKAEQEKKPRRRNVWNQVRAPLLEAERTY